MKHFVAVGVLVMLGTSNVPAQSALDSSKPLALSGAPKAIQTTYALPPEVERAGIEGSVLLRFIVEGSGHVQEVRVEKSSHPLLTRTFLDAAKSWEFTPTYRDGRAVSVSFPLVVGIGREPLQDRSDRIALYTAGTSSVRLKFDIPFERASALPRWSVPTLDGPSLTKSEAAAIGAAWIRSHRPSWALRSTEVELRSVGDVSGRGKVWYYVTLFSTSAIDEGSANSDDIDFPLVAIVLLDGTIVEPSAPLTP